MSAPRPTPRKTASRVLGDRLELLAARDPRAEPKLDSELLERARLVGKRVANLPIRGDRVADEPADLLALVEDGDRVAARGELACAGEAGRAGADDDDPSAVRPERASGGVGRARRTNPSRSAGARRSRSAAGPRARGRRRPRTGPRPGRRVRRCRRGCSRSKIVVGSGFGISVGDLRDEARDVDSGGAGDGARRGSVRPAALEAAVRFDERLGRRERRPQLLESELWLRRCAHTASVRAARCIAIRAQPVVRARESADGPRRPPAYGAAGASGAARRRPRSRTGTEGARRARPGRAPRSRTPPGGAVRRRPQRRTRARRGSPRAGAGS